MAHAFGSCAEAHPNSCPDIVALVQVETVVQKHIGRIADRLDCDRLKEELNEVMTSSVLIKHQSFVENKAPSGLSQISAQQSPAR